MGSGGLAREDVEGRGMREGKEVKGEEIRHHEKGSEWKNG